MAREENRAAHLRGRLNYGIGMDHCPYPKEKGKSSFRYFWQGWNDAREGKMKVFPEWRGSSNGC